MERGLRPSGSGWPFRRELRELASLFSPRRRPTPSAPALVKEQNPCEA